jgi:glyoxylase-like metal-dependent hydrolase (beta-lactamase superfamily II)
MTLRIERFGDVTRVRMSSVGSRFARLDVSAYVVRGVMIDSGFHRVRHALAAAIHTLGVRGVIVTHWHEDHAGNVPMLAELGIPILMRQDTADILRRRPAIQLYRRVVWGHPPALAVDPIAFDVPGLEAFHAPGHSTDHQVVFDHETGTLFSGDLWLGVRSRVLHASEDPYVIVQSLRRAAALRPSRMFDAHRGLVADAVSALEARADWLEETLADVQRLVLDGWSDARIVTRVLGGEELSAWASHGDYSRRNLVKAVRRNVASQNR